MRIAVSSQGTSLDAWAGVAFDSCSQFVVVDTEAMDVLIVSVSTDEQPAGERRRALLRALVDHGASVIITGRLSELCRADFPAEEDGLIPEDHRRNNRSPRPLSEFAGEMERINNRLEAMKEPTVLKEELISGRLCE